MIKIENLRKNYPGFSLDLDHLQVAEGTVCGLVGTNGSGKSTTFKILLGLIQPDAGKAEVLDQNAWKLPVSLKQEIGAVFNDSGFDCTFTLSDIAAVLKAFYPTFDEPYFYELCAQMDLPQNQAISKFSTGMAVRIKVISAISHHPRVLILDEPTAGLDVLARHKILDLISMFMEQPRRAVLISSHIASDLEEICDDFYMIHDGKLLLHQTIDNLLNHYGILVLSQSQFDELDKTGAVAMVKDRNAIRVLVSDRKFYQENYPDLVLDKSGIDDVIEIFEEGSRL